MKLDTLVYIFLFIITTGFVISIFTRKMNEKFVNKLALLTMTAETIVYFAYFLFGSIFCKEEIIYQKFGFFGTCILCIPILIIALAVTFIINYAGFFIKMKVLKSKNKY